MTDIPYRTVLIVGAGISASFARALATAGLRERHRMCEHLPDLVSAKNFVRPGAKA
jgi:hypothetical protein